ncbi:AAA family ATPase [Blastococcus sp. TF02-8]|uniref:AAA family ATPase n=1 Tax=Blastococcus sp. TF02-8 TaxID=2250574 RepID=UPI001412BE5D|nr:AAA family ATPase [Blastococcus sp. TF02-8]
MRDSGAPGLTLLGTNSGSGKSLLLRSFAWLRRASGQPVDIYKPIVALLTPVESGDDTVDLSLHLSALAGGFDDAKRLYSYTYDVGSTGELRDSSGASCGVPAAVSDDGVDVLSLPPSVAAEVTRRIEDEVRGRDAFLLSEGAGAVADLPPDRDVSNGLLALWARRPVVLVAGARRGGAAAGVLGAQALMDPALAALVTGFVLNNVRDMRVAEPAARRLEQRTGWPCLGVVPSIPLYANLPPGGAAHPVLESWDEDNRVVAQWLTGQLDTGLLRQLTAPCTEVA